MKVFYILLVFALIISCQEKREKTQPLQEKITESVYASGIVKSKNQYKVFSLVNGVIEKVFVTEGDLVKKDEIIIQLTNSAAEINTQNAKLSADYASVASNTEKLNELKIAIEIAKIKKDNDELLLQKQENLWAQQVGTQNELVQKQLNFKTSKNSYSTANLRYLELIKQINFQEKQSKINLELSRKVNNDYSIKSDVDGKVYELSIQDGEMVNTLSPVAIIGDNLNFFLELQVDEYDINRVKLKQKIALSMDSFKGQVFEGLVTKINPLMNDKTKSFTIEASFINPPKMLFPNLTCEANIIIQQKASAITIPRNYLLDGDFLLLENDKKVKVKTGLKDYQKVEILAGITAADVIYKPQQ